MERHKHYQAIRALADGWTTESSCDGDVWYRTEAPAIHTYVRIVPDEEGWLPWYGGDKAPIEGKFDVIFRDKAINLEGHKNGIGDTLGMRLTSLNTAHIKKKKNQPNLNMSIFG